MTDHYYNKRKFTNYHKDDHPVKRLSDIEYMTVKKHINSVYVGTVIRLLGSYSNDKGRLATAHWMDKRGIFVTYHFEEISTFIDLRDKTFVVDHEFVRPGSFQLFTKFGTSDMEHETKKKTVNEIKQQNRRILMNDTMMKFPTETDRSTYECCLFMLTCNCGYSKQVKNTHVLTRTRKM